MTEIDEYLKFTASSNNLVKIKLKNCEKVLTVLFESNQNIEEYVWSSRKAILPPNVERAAYDLRNIYNEMTRLESRRRKRTEKVREKVKEDDICKVFVFLHRQHS